MTTMTHTFDDEKVAEALEIIKIGSVVKSNIIKQTQRDTAAFLMGTLKAVIHEQMDACLIDREEGLYILDSLFDQCLRRGFIE